MHNSERVEPHIDNNLKVDDSEPYRLLHSVREVKLNGGIPCKLGQTWK